MKRIPSIDVIQSVSCKSDTGIPFRNDALALDSVSTYFMCASSHERYTMVDGRYTHLPVRG